MPVPFSFRDFRREPDSISAFIEAGHPREAFRLALLWQLLSFVLVFSFIAFWFFAR